MKPYDYDEEFIGAYQRTAAFGLTAPAMPPPVTGRLFRQRRDQRLASILRSALGGLSPHDVAAQCFAIHHLVGPMIDRAYDVHSVLTLGWVHDPPCDFFRSSETELRSVMRDGIAGAPLNLHCWLTLPTREILDCTLATTKAVAERKPEQYGLAIAKHWREFTGGLRYHPLLVGPKFLEQAGALVVL